MAKNNNNKKVLFGALSAVAASVAAGLIVKKTMENKNESKENEIITEVAVDKNASKKEKVWKEKKNRKVYYTMKLNDLYNPYDDKTFSEEDMIDEIRRETSL